MEEIDSQTDPLAEIVDDYLSRLRSGESLAIEEYAARHPEMADRVRQMLGMVRGLEQLRSRSIDEAAREPSFSTFAGRRLGDFVLVREIGRGGMGVVYEAIQESLGRRVALKLFLSGPQDDAIHRERFEREARAAANLHHTNIVPVFAVGREAELVFYAMQYLRGHSLDCVIASLRSAGLPHGTLHIHGAAPASESASPMIDSTPIDQGLLPLANDTPRPADDTVPRAVGDRLSVAAGEAASWLRGTPAQNDGEQSYFQNVARLGMHAAEALAYAHQQGVLHRDIKPSNLFLDHAGTIWLTDFGLAKAQGHQDLTATGDILGTLRYMPHERLKGESLPQGDVYSLGVTLHELLTLRPAFDVPDRAQLIDKLLHEPVPPPSRFVPAIPRDLDTIITRATAHDPRDRYLTAAAFAADLRHFLQDETIDARRLGAVEKLQRWVRRNPILTGLAAAILLLSLSLALGSTYAALRIAAARDQAISARSLESDARELAEQKSADEQRQRQRAEEHLTRALGAETQATAAALRSQREAKVAERVAGYLLELFADPDPYHWRSIADEATAHGERLARPELIARLDRQMEQYFVELRDKPDELVSRLQAAALGNGFLFPNFPTRRVLEQALTIGQRTQGLSHPRTTWTIFWLGKSFDLEGRPEFAEPFLRKCVEVWQRGGDPALQPADLGNGALGTVLLKKGRLAEAEFCLREAVALCRQKNDLASLAAWLSALASVLERQDELSAAEQCQVESVQLLSGLHGATDHRTLEAQVKRAEILRLNQDLAAAEEILHDSLSGWLEPRNRQQTGRVDALIELSRVLARQGRQDEAERFAREAVEAANGMSAGYRGLRERANDALLDTLISRDSAAEVDLLAAKIVEAQWRNAAEAHREALRLFQQADSCAAAEDQAGYATACRQILERFQDSESADIALTVARACYLAPSGLDNYGEVLQLVNWGIAIQPDNRNLQVARGALLYRAGECDKAAEFLLPLTESGVRTHKGTSLERFFLAAALAKLGDSAAATHWFESGAEWLVNNATQAADTTGVSLPQAENSGSQAPQGKDPWRELRSLQCEIRTVVYPQADRIP